MSRLCLTIDYGTFFVWNNTVNGQAPDNNLYLSLINLSEKPFKGYDTSGVLTKEYLYIERIAMHFNMGENENCLMRREEIKNIICETPYGKIEPENLLSDSAFVFSPPATFVDSSTDNVKSVLFSISSLICAAKPGTAPVKTEVLYHYVEDGVKQIGKEVILTPIIKDEPRLEILYFYSKHDHESGSNETVLYWDAPCADYCLLEIDEKLSDTKYTSRAQYTADFPENTSVVLIAVNKKNTLRSRQTVVI